MVELTHLEYFAACALSVIGIVAYFFAGIWVGRNYGTLSEFTEQTLVRRMDEWRRKIERLEAQRRQR